MVAKNTNVCSCISVEKAKKEETSKTANDDGSGATKNKSLDKHVLSNIIHAKESWQSGILRLSDAIYKIFRHLINDQIKCSLLSDLCNILLCFAASNNRWRRG